MNLNNLPEKAVGKEFEIISPHPDSNVFDEYLNNFQEDINRIIGKFRYESHQLSHADLVSEANLSLIKKRDEILSNFSEDFTEANFKKLAYSFVRNIIKWTQWRIARSPYVNKRSNFEHSTEDGYKTTFDLAIEKGEYGEEDFYENFDRNAKYSFLLKMIKEYSSILTDKEVKVLTFLEKGMNHYEIADKLEITHQAVSLMSIKIADKIKAHLSKDALKDNSYDQVSKGHKSIANFFKIDSKNAPMEDKDKCDLRKFLFKNARAYTSSQASKVFLNGKYSNRQIASFGVRNKLSFCLIRKNIGYKFSIEENDNILSLFKKGKSSKEVSSSTGIPLHSIIGKRGSLVRSGLLEKRKR
jgi:RNA polymerase sigma factor (sigma-70 family)